jgi:D-sedoheptulose 7-phosphate isomerase
MNHSQHLFTRLSERYPALEACRANIEAAYSALAEVFENGGKLLVCGNGGSAADAEHIVGELMKGFQRLRPIPEPHRQALREIAGDAAGEDLAGLLQGALRAVALTSHGSLVTAIANDTRADMIFAQQVYGLGERRDALLGISTSGNARNVVHAFHVARLLGLKTVALTGRSGGKLAPLADIAIRAPADEVYEIQELHLPIYHALCAALEARFFAG